MIVGWEKAQKGSNAKLYYNMMRTQNFLKEFVSTHEGRKSSWYTETKIYRKYAEG